jgi:lipopolysaccharide transport system ATP-binding protein
MSVVIKLENVSKQYRLGLIGTNTLKGDLQRWWYNIRGLPDPTLIIGQENTLSTAINSPLVAQRNNFIWALKDINFEVKQGDVLGIIGKNGAGKSTLLKLLSRVTAPTKGNIKVKGRIASLLEVGTGFHPELTGRENIFLNGAILGMTKVEIRSKLDEIVNFAGVTKYIDTPVKRYSSGMYVRLAFAVAAHLEPEILIIDEVLAVGDAEFQKKAIGKMQNISQTEGKTVLFVSHNMGAVKNLCRNGLLLINGNIEYLGEISHVIDKYLYERKIHDNGIRLNYPGKSLGYFTSWRIVGRANNDFTIYSDEDFKIEFSFFLQNSIINCELGLVFRNSEGQLILGCNSRDSGGHYLALKEGSYRFLFDLRLPLTHGDYEVDIAFVSNNQVLDQWVSTTKLTILNKFESILNDKWRGVLNVKTNFHYETD